MILKISIIVKHIIVLYFLLYDSLVVGTGKMLPLSAQCCFEVLPGRDNCHVSSLLSPVIVAKMQTIFSNTLL